MSALTHTPRFSVEGIREHEDAHHPTSEINVGDAERWASTIGGTLLVAQGLRRGTFGGLALALIGGGLVYRGITGNCQAYKALNIDTSDKHRSVADEHVHSGRLIKHTVTVDRPAGDLYSFWRDVHNAPKYQLNIESVEKKDEKHSRWVSSGPLGKKFAWDSEIINDEPGRLIAWKSLPGGDVNLAGSVRFDQLPGDRGTVVTLELNYEPPAGLLGVAVARILGQDPDKIVREDLRRFKMLMEAGEIATIQGQPTGGAWSPS